MFKGPVFQKFLPGFERCISKMCMEILSLSSMYQSCTQRQYILILQKTAEVYSVGHVVIYSTDHYRFRLSAQLSRTIIQQGLRWLNCETPEFPAFNELVEAELSNIAVNAGLTAIQIVPDVLGMTQRRFSLN